jgi:hypothetical protein
MNGFVSRSAIRILAGLLAGVPLWAQFAGPAILARGEAPAAMSGVAISFRPFISISAVYDTGLAGISLTDQGQLATAASYGTTISGGVSGTHLWKKTMLGLDYRGSYTRYSQASNNNGYDQSFRLGLTHQINRHLQFALNESAGLFTRDFGLAGLSETVPFDPVSTYVPTTDFFDNRTIYVTSMANMVYQRSLRLSFGFGGGLFVNRRLSSALYGAIGESAQGDVQYRLSRRQTLGAVYGFNHMGYTHVLGGTFVHSYSGSYSIRPTRRVEFSGTGGVLRQENKFLQSVAVDPVIAALLGITETAQLYHSISWHPHFSARLSRTFHHGVVYVTAGNAVTPGNGLFLTSYATTAQGGYAYTGLRRWSVKISGGEAWSQAYGNVAGKYSTATAQASVARNLGRNTNATLTFSARQYGSPDYQHYNRLIYSVGLGFAFSPGEIPLRIW